MSEFDYSDEVLPDLGNTKKLIEEYCSKEWIYIINMYKSEADYQGNQIIFPEGERIKFVHIIDSGKVKIFSTFVTGKERILRLAGNGSIIGHRGIGEDFTYSASAVALTEVRATLIPINLFKSVLRANNLFSYYFMLFFAEELRRSERQIKDLEGMTVAQKVAKALIMNLEVFGFDKDDNTLLSYTLSRKDISKLAGSTYESIIRILSTFNAQGILKIEGKKIRVLDKIRLKNLLKSPNISKNIPRLTNRERN